MIYKASAYFVRFVFWGGRQSTLERLTGMAMVALGLAIMASDFRSPITDSLVEFFSFSPMLIVAIFIACGSILFIIGRAKSVVFLALTMPWLLYSIGGLIQFAVDAYYVSVVWSGFIVVYLVQIYLRKFLMEFIYQHRLHNNFDEWLSQSPKEADRGTK